MKKKKVVKLSDRRAERKSKDSDTLQTIVSALQYLKSEAQKSGQDDVTMILDCAAKLCFSIYYYQARGEYEPKGVN
jgi:hypothetical protein